MILEDNHYDFNFQASRQVPEGRGHVLPGDELILECEYSTTGIITYLYTDLYKVQIKSKYIYFKGTDKITFGGLSTREEMCLGFILYYPRSPLADCR